MEDFDLIMAIMFSISQIATNIMFAVLIIRLNRKAEELEKDIGHLAKRCWDLEMSAEQKLVVSSKRKQTLLNRYFTALYPDTESEEDDPRPSDTDIGGLA